MPAPYSTAHAELREQPLDSADRHVISLMGISEADYRATQRRQGVQIAMMSVAAHDRARIDSNGLDAIDHKIIALMGLREAEYQANKTRRHR